MSSTKKTDSAGWLDGVSGRELLERALQRGHLDIVEAFWRYREPGLAAVVADCILRGDSAQLAALIVDEIVEPTMTDPLPAEIMTTLSQHRPRLPESTTGKLAGRLGEATPFPQNHYEASRGVLER